MKPTARVTYTKKYPITRICCFYMRAGRSGLQAPCTKDCGGKITWAPDSKSDTAAPDVQECIED